MSLAPDHYDLAPAEVRRRFEWARRQGDPAWLWPDLSIEQWREALGRIEDCVRAILSDGSSDVPLDGNPDAIGLACYTSGTGPLLGWWVELKMLAASPRVAAILELHLRHNRRRAASLRAATALLADALHDHGVGVVLLKGMHTEAAYFPEPGTRPASDVDLLVHSAQAPAAETILRSAGYVSIGRGPRESNWRLPSVPVEPRSLMLVHSGDPWSVDLHVSLDISVGRGLPPARLDLAEPMDSSGTWQAHCGVRVLDQPLLLLHLAVHAGAGLHNLTLLRLIELEAVIRKDGAAGSLSWDDFLALAQTTGSLGYAYPALRMCDRLSPGTVPEPVLARCSSEAPGAVVRIVDGLEPATAQRVARSSVAEHFMWADGWRARLGQLVVDLVAPGPWRALGPIYRKRAWQLFRRRISR